MRTPSHDTEADSDLAQKGFRPSSALSLDQRLARRENFASDQVGQPAARRQDEKYRLWLAGNIRCFWQAGLPPPVKELRGKNLACWCGPHERCYGGAILQFLCEPDPYNRETIME